MGLLKGHCENLKYLLSDPLQCNLTLFYCVLSRIKISKIAFQDVVENS